MTTTTRPASTVTHHVWTVVVDMPTFSEGRQSGKPVGWRSTNKLHRNVGEKIRFDAAGRAWRIAAYQALVLAGVPQHLGFIEYDVTVRYAHGDRQVPRDVENLELTLKPVVDALGRQRIYRSAAKKRDYGIVVELGREIVEEDSPKFVRRTGVTIGSRLPKGDPSHGKVILTIRKAAPGVPAFRLTDALAEFHQHIGQPPWTGPFTEMPPSTVALRKQLLTDEVTELFTALDSGDPAAIVQELADVVYTAAGMAYTYNNLPLDAALAAVHAANMTKQPGADGKAVKGPGFRPPDIAGAFTAAGWHNPKEKDQP